MPPYSLIYHHGKLYGYLVCQLPLFGLVRSAAFIRIHRWKLFLKSCHAVKCYSAAQQCVYPSVVEDISTHPNCFISYGILIPSVWKQPHSGLLVGRVDQSTVISSVEKRLINEPTQGAIDPTHHWLIFTLITLSTAWQFNTVGGKQLSSWTCLHQASHR